VLQDELHVSIYCIISASGHGAFGSHTGYGQENTMTLVPCGIYDFFDFTCPKTQYTSTTAEKGIGLSN
jgi:hypothetical protein